MIRTARLWEILRLQEIEVAAGEPFRELGMLSVADDDPPSSECLMEAIEREMCWVYETRTAGVVAYLAAIGLDASLHIEQVSVDPAFARLRYGARLIEHAEQDAAARGYPLLTLTTFTEVPWNAPYYSSLGFREHLNQELEEVLSHEDSFDAEDWPRIGMAREVSAAHRVLAASGTA
ncbi:GNAT family N-acetyltransferase [Tomitella biformata]|uniref:GNAT family N-acetyltransferase n=1 Tax=Tomitella biformata TaxID=630403 RepID=UPI0004665B09|nr:GNAT family N-acetyltransferase [Tomitella biformata]